MRIRPSREKKIFYIKTVSRWIVYYIIIFALFAFMTSGTYLKPMILIPTAICIAMKNDMMGSAFTGAFCGLLTDIACGKLFGYNAVLLTVFCVGTSLMFSLYLRNKFINFLWISGICSFIQCCLDYEFFYGLWGYEDVETIFWNTHMNSFAMTVISSVFVYIIFGIVNRFLMPKEHLSIHDIIASQPESNLRQIKPPESRRM